MQATPETLNALSSYLASTVSPDAATRRAAEDSLRQGEGQPGFLQLILQLVKSDGVDMTVRQAGGVYFKNVVKKLWAGEEVRVSCGAELTDQETQITQEDKNAIKAQLVPVMIALGTPTTARLQSQIGEALSMIAAQDFPENWEGLCDVSEERASKTC
jgi:exportin-2 (importin alpha re-exporter)